VVDLDEGTVGALLGHRLPLGRRACRLEAGVRRQLARPRYRPGERRAVPPGDDHEAVRPARGRGGPSPGAPSRPPARTGVAHARRRRAPRRCLQAPRSASAPASHPARQRARGPAEPAGRRRGEDRAVAATPPAAARRAAGAPVRSAPSWRWPCDRRLLHTNTPPGHARRNRPASRRIGLEVHDRPSSPADVVPQTSGLCLICG
jgi:hypothetical protein